MVLLIKLHRSFKFNLPNVYQNHYVYIILNSKFYYVYIRMMICIVMNISFIRQFFMRFVSSTYRTSIIIITYI